MIERDTTLTPTSGGSFQDPAGALWTLAPNGSVMRNGVPVPGGAGTGALELIDGVVCGRNGTTGDYFCWTGSAWQASGALHPKSDSTIASSAPAATATESASRTAADTSTVASSTNTNTTTISPASSSTTATRKPITEADATLMAALTVARTAVQDALKAIQAAIVAISQD